MATESLKSQEELPLKAAMSSGLALKLAPSSTPPGNLSTTKSTVLLEMVLVPG